MAGIQRGSSGSSWQKQPCNLDRGFSAGERESWNRLVASGKKKQLPHKHAKQSPDEPEKPWMPVHPRITKETEESQKQTLVSLYHNQCLKNQMLQIRPTDLLV